MEALPRFSSMTSGLTASHLELTQQTSLQEEKVTRSGKTHSIHVVVKNSPFHIVLGISHPTSNFNHLAFDMKLLYDMSTEKEVPFVSQKPVDYKPYINDLGDRLTLDIKIKVLSSHHEDNFFRLKILVWDPNTGAAAPAHIYSHPIKVISKPMKQRKPRATATPSTKRTRPTPPPATNMNSNNFPSASFPSSSDSSMSPNSMSMIPSSFLGADTGSGQALQRIDQQQAEALSLLHQVLDMQHLQQGQLQHLLSASFSNLNLSGLIQNPKPQQTQQQMPDIQQTQTQQEQQQQQQQNDSWFHQEDDIATKKRRLESISNSPSLSALSSIAAFSQPNPTNEEKPSSEPSFFSPEFGSYIHPVSFNKDKYTNTNTNTNTTGGNQPQDNANGNANLGDFEGAFSSMLAIYASLTAEQKAERVRKLLRSFHMKELEVIEEMFDVFSTAGALKVNNVPSFTTMYGQGCDCSEGCPHKMELERIDEFYSEVFF